MTNRVRPMRKRAWLGLQCAVPSWKLTQGLGPCALPTPSSTVGGSKHSLALSHSTPLLRLLSWIEPGCARAGGFGLHRSRTALGVIHYVVAPWALAPDHKLVPTDPTDARHLALELDQFVEGAGKRKRHGALRFRARSRFPACHRTNMPWAVCQQVCRGRKIRTGAGAGISRLLCCGFPTPPARLAALGPRDQLACRGQAVGERAPPRPDQPPKTAHS